MNMSAQCIWGFYEPNRHHDDDDDNDGDDAEFIYVFRFAIGPIFIVTYILLSFARSHVRSFARFQASERKIRKTHLQIGVIQ